MPKFTVSIDRVVTDNSTFEISAESQDEANDKAEEMISQFDNDNAKDKKLEWYNDSTEYSVEYVEEA